MATCITFSEKHPFLGLMQEERFIPEEQHNGSIVEDPFHRFISVSNDMSGDLYDWLIKDYIDWDRYGRKKEPVYTRDYVLHRDVPRERIRSIDDDLIDRYCQYEAGLVEGLEGSMPVPANKSSRPKRQRQHYQPYHPVKSAIRWAEIITSGDCKIVSFSR